MKYTKKALISIALVGTLLSGSFSSIPFASASGNVVTVSKKVSYNDYQDNQYWSQDMLWAIDQGLIQGFMNAKHPTNKNIKTVGNWIDPQGGLIESQMLAVLFRFAKKEELATTKPIDSKWWASTPYQLAAKYSVPTKGSLKNRNASNTVMTRGNLSQALATLFFGKQVSMETAVQFMYDADISSGLPDKNGKYLKTYQSYGVNDPLKRAHIVSFIKRYDTFKKSGKEVDEFTPKQVVDGIEVEFGKHKYGSRSQTEYNKVMQVINRGMANYKDLPLGGESHEEYYYRYLDGERPNDYTWGSKENISLKSAEYGLKAFMDNGVSHSVAIDVNKAVDAAWDILVNAKGEGVRKDCQRASAYDQIFNVASDSISHVEILSAGFDKAGYVTAIVKKLKNNVVSSPTILVKVEGNWYAVHGGGFYHMSESYLEENHYRVTTEPTDGSKIYSLNSLKWYYYNMCQKF